MKKIIYYIVMIVFITSFASCIVHERYVVKERPPEVIYTRTAQPSPEHIWVTGDWIWSSRSYHWHEGHWEIPRQGVKWEDGRWQNTRDGWKWIHGHWQNN